MLKTVTLNGIRCKIDLITIDGMAQDHTPTAPYLLLCRDLSTKAGLNTAIHEAIHIECPGFTEERVDQIATDLSRLLWGLGYRYYESEKLPS